MLQMRNDILLEDRLVLGSSNIQLNGEYSTTVLRQRHWERRAHSEVYNHAIPFPHYKSIVIKFALLATSKNNTTQQSAIMRTFVSIIIPALVSVSHLVYAQDCDLVQEQACCYGETDDDGDTSYCCNGSIVGNPSSSEASALNDLTCC